jgi:RNA polymerase sigma factor (sigma-70 family)
MSSKMTATTAAKAMATKADSQLVKRCIAGDEQAWAHLLERYKNLIFSIPMKYGFSRDDAADIFQMVCADLLTELPRLRETAALPAWLIRVTSHKCFHRTRELRRFTGDEPEDMQLPAEGALPEAMLQEVQQEQAVRQAISTLAPRCQRLIRMLFYESPCRPYTEIAQELGLAEGSIGFIRGRCLEKLRQGLQNLGIE